jgi:hypothetical protein
MDTFDFARRAELLGIGRWGNRSAVKSCKGGELGPILIDVLLGGRSSGYEKKAKELAEICNAYGGGRVVAARHILAEYDPERPPVAQFEPGWPEKSEAKGDTGKEMLLNGHRP